MVFTPKKLLLSVFSLSFFSFPLYGDSQNSLSLPHLSFNYNEVSDRVVLTTQFNINLEPSQALKFAFGNKYDGDFKDIFGVNPPKLESETKEIKKDSWKVTRVLTIYDDDGALRKAREMISFSNQILKTVLVELDSEPEDPWPTATAPEIPSDRLPASEAIVDGVICATCLSTTLEAPLTKFIKDTKDLIEVKCPVEAPSTPASLLLLRSSCIRGVLTSLVGFVQGIYQLFTFLINTEYDPQYRMALEAKTSELAWAASRHPIDMASNLLKVVSGSVEKAFGDFQNCGPEYQVATICRVFTNLLLPGGILFKALQKWRVAQEALSSVARVEKAVLESLEVQRPKLVPSVKMVSRMSKEEVSDAGSMLREEIDPKRKVSLATSERRLQNKAKLVGTEISPEAKALKSNLSKLEKIQDKETVEFHEANRNIASQLKTVIEQTGLKAELSFIKPNTEELEESIKRSEGHLATFESHGLNDKNPLVTNLKEIIAKRKNNLKKIQNGQSSDYTIQINLESHPLLRDLRQKFNLKGLEIDSQMEDLGTYSAGIIKLNPAVMAKAGGHIEYNSTFFHEVHHLTNARKFERGVKGPMYVQYYSSKVGTYTNYMSFDEIPAWKRTLRYSDKYMQPNHLSPEKTFAGLTERAIIKVRQAQSALTIQKKNKDFFSRTRDPLLPSQAKESFRIDLKPRDAEPDEYEFLDLQIVGHRPQKGINAVHIVNEELSRLEALLLQHQKSAIDEIKKAKAEKKFNQNVFKLLQDIFEEH